MGPLTEGSMRHAEKKRNNVRPKAPPPAPIPKSVSEKKIKHNKGLHTQVSLYNIMSASLLFGTVVIFLAKTLGILLIVHIVSILISLGAIYLLPKFKSINIRHAINMRYNVLVLWCILFLGSIMTILILTTILLPPRKKKGGSS